MGKKYVRHRDEDGKKLTNGVWCALECIVAFFLLSPGNNNKFWSIRRIFCTLLPWIHSISLSLSQSSHKRSPAYCEFTLLIFISALHFQFNARNIRTKDSPIPTRKHLLIIGRVCVHLYSHSSIKMSLFVVNIFEENSSFSIPMSLLPFFCIIFRFLY